MTSSHATGKARVKDLMSTGCALDNTISQSRTCYRNDGGRKRHGHVPGTVLSNTIIDDQCTFDSLV